MRPALWLRFARRDLRSGLQGFWIFLLCLFLGTAAIAVIGSLAAAVSRGIAEQGQPLLGGDAEFALIHREATAAELAFLKGAGTVSRVATLRVMAASEGQATLAEAKVVDGAYPLYSAVGLVGGGTLTDALGLRDGRHGVAVDPLLLARLGIAEGARLRIGTGEFAVRAVIAVEPDRISDGIILGPRLLLSPEALAETGLVVPGSLITWRYRVRLPPPAPVEAVAALIASAEASFPEAGWRIRGRDAAAQGADRFVSRLGFFLTLVGLSSLIIGGAGIANAVAAFVSRRTASIATLKCLGASASDIFGIYLTEILLVALLAIGLGIGLGALAPALAHWLLAGTLPLPVAPGIEPAALATAGLLALLVTLAFALWPLARTRAIAASALFRSLAAPVPARPATTDLAAIAIAFAAMAAIVFLRFDETRLTAWFLAGLAASFVVLLALARAIVWLAPRLPQPRSAQWRHALANLHRPGAATVSVVLALGLGLTLLVTLALADRTISAELRAGLPDRAPAFFFLDVRNDERAAFTAALASLSGVAAVETAPMLRGRIVAVKGVPADKVAVSADAAWALRGDRGLTYAASLPAGSVLSAGQWWPADYDGPPLVSLVGEIARGLDLSIGDEITVNVLGRELTARVANLRDVNWRSLAINFVMVFSPNTLEDAPHRMLTTLEFPKGTPAEREGKVIQALAEAYPLVTAIKVGDIVDAAKDMLGKVMAAIGATAGVAAHAIATGVHQVRERRKLPVVPSAPGKE